MAGEKKYLEKWIPARDEGLKEWEQAGWSFERKKGTRYLMRRQIKKWERLEIKVRSLFLRLRLQDAITDPYDFEYRELGPQVDACGGIGKIFLVVDCYSASEPKTTDLSSKLQGTHWKKDQIMKRVQSLFGEKYQTVRYVIATEDAEVTKDVSDEAMGKEIYIVDSTFFENCINFAETMGEALRFQILKRVGITDFSALDGSAQPLHYPAIKMTAGERTLYHFAIHPEDLIKLAYVYRLELADPRGYQRPLKIDKIRKINQFIAAKGYFANNIVLCFDNVGARGVSFEAQGASPGTDGDSIGVGTLTIPARIGIAEIVDGQHRLYGYLDSDKERKYDRILARRRKEDLLGVTAIADPREDERPLLFLDINANQTKVSAQNVWALMARWRPTTEIGFTAKVLYELAKCPPFKGRITIPSKTPAGLPLNIANFAKALKDRRLVAMGGQGENLNWNLFDGDRASSTYPLEVPKKTTQTLVRYFTAIRGLYPNDWKAGKKGYTCTNDGAGVLLRVLTELLKYTYDSGLSPTAQVMHGALSGILDSELNGPGHIKALKRQSLGEAGRDAVAKRLCTRIAAKQSFKGFAESYTKRRGKK